MRETVTSPVSLRYPLQLIAEAMLGERVSQGAFRYLQQKYQNPQVQPHHAAA